MADPDARRRAEEALVFMDAALRDDMPPLPSQVRWLADAVRALLAAGPGAGAGGLDALAIEINEWAAVTFPFRTAASVAEHLRREAHELAEAPLDPEEMADVFILLANLWKLTGVDLPCAVAAKLAKNRARKWGKPDAQGVVEHVREGPQALAAGAATPPPPSDAVREAAEVVRTILTAHDARLSESGVLTYGPPSEGTGFVAAIQWLRRYDAARGGE